jgi:hypothetical protein
MNNSPLKHLHEQTEESLTSNQEDFNQINAMVENLLESLNQNKRQNLNLVLARNGKRPQGKNKP